jgi:hypothetical protein
MGDEKGGRKRMKQKKKKSKVRKKLNGQQLTTQILTDWSPCLIEVAKIKLLE